MSGILLSASLHLLPVYAYNILIVLYNALSCLLYLFLLLAKKSGTWLWVDPDLGVVVRSPCAFGPLVKFKYTSAVRWRGSFLYEVIWRGGSHPRASKTRLDKKQCSCLVSVSLIHLWGQQSLRSCEWQLDSYVVHIHRLPLSVSVYIVSLVVPGIVKRGRSCRVVLWALLHFTGTLVAFLTEWLNEFVLLMVRYFCCCLKVIHLSIGVYSFQSKNRDYIF